MNGEDPHTLEQHCQAQACRAHQEDVEAPVVVLADACAQHVAVVVEAQDAPVARFAVSGARRAINPAGLAELELHEIVKNGDMQVVPGCRLVG